MQKFLSQLSARCLLTVALLISAGISHANGLNNYIVGGSAVSSNAQYPFMASIYFDATGTGNYRHSCGGSLIADRWVLTAAHCLVNNNFDRLVSIDRMQVILGETNLAARGGASIGVKQLIAHPLYDASSHANDIALIELTDAYAGARVVLPSTGSTVPVLGEPGIVLGWGAIREGGSLSARLREVSLPVISNTACFPAYVDRFDSRVAFCAGGGQAGGIDSCQGDSGGPLLVQRGSIFVIAGIVSYGDGCARPGIPGVYSRVEAFTDWIVSHTKGTTLEYVGRTDAQVVDNTVITRLEVNSSASGLIGIGQVAYFDVSGARQVNLTSNSGDADLLIIDDANFQEIAAELVRCVSNHEIDVVDICAIDDTSTAYAVVYGFTDASFTISSQFVASDVNVVQPFGNSAQSGSGGGLALGSVAKYFLMLLVLVLGIRVETLRRPA